MKKIFFTPPNAHLDLSSYGTNNFYCLGQIYKKNPEYKKYALKAKQDGRFIILDSGVGDHGKPLTNKELFEVACELKPNEVIPLDELYNVNKTIYNTIQMYEWLVEAGLDSEIDILMCPQGNNLFEWFECYKTALNMPFVKTIGLSKKTIPHIVYGASSDEKIIESRHLIFDILKLLKLLTKPIHLLGSGGPAEYQYYKNEPLIRSTDSCVAIWEGMNGNMFDNPEYKRIPTPADYFELVINKEQFVDVYRNMLLFLSNLGESDNNK